MMMNINELFDELNECFSQALTKTQMKSDVVEYKDGFMVLTDLPGVSKDRVELSFDNNVLSINVKDIEEDKVDYLLHERNVKYAKKEIYFKNNVDYDNASAQFENGVLKIYLPKIAKKNTTIKID